MVELFRINYNLFARGVVQFIAETLPKFCYKFIFRRCRDMFRVVLYLAVKVMGVVVEPDIPTDCR